MDVQEYQESAEARVIVLAHQVLLKRLTAGEEQGLRALLRFRSMHLRREKKRASF